MNQEQAIAFVRQLIITLMGTVLGAGYFDQAATTTIAGALAVLVVTIGWGLYARRTNGLVASAAAQKGVSQITADPKIADAVPNTKVVAQ